MTLDPVYEQTDRASPHFAHYIQPLGEGGWVCTTCVPDWQEYAMLTGGVGIEGIDS